MKLALLIISFIIAAQALSDVNSQQGSLLGEQLTSELQNSKFGRAILKLAQMKNTVQQVDFSRLFDALDDLAESIKERIQEEKADLEKNYQQFIADSDFYGNQVTEFKAEQAQHQVDVDTLKAVRGELSKMLESKNNEVFMTNRLIQEMEMGMKKAERQYNAQVKDYDNSITVVDKSIEQMQKVRDDQGAFVQVTQGEVNYMGKQLEKHMGSLKKKFLYSPLVETFLELSDAKFADQQLVAKVIKLLQKLREELVASKGALQGTYQGELKQQQEILQEFNVKVAQLSDEIIPKLQEDIEVKNGQIGTKQELLNDATDNLNAAQDNLDNTNQRWTARQAQNKELMEEYDTELQVIGQTIAALERGGVRRPQ